MRGLPSKRPPQPAANADGHCRAAPLVGAECIAAAAAPRITVWRGDKLFSNYFPETISNYFETIYETIYNTIAKNQFHMRLARQSPA